MTPLFKYNEERFIRNVVATIIAIPLTIIVVTIQKYSSDKIIGTFLVFWGIAYVSLKGWEILNKNK
jgi:hypothetical protein